MQHSKTSNEYAPETWSVITDESSSSQWMHRIIICDIEDSLSERIQIRQYMIFHVSLKREKRRSFRNFLL